MTPEIAGDIRLKKETKKLYADFVKVQQKEKGSKRIRQERERERGGCRRRVGGASACSAARNKRSRLVATCNSGGRAVCRVDVLHGA